MDAATRKLVRDRAGDRCEYCRLAQDDEPYYRFHVEHVVPRQHGGGDDPSNLALACHYCNLHKGPNLSGIDPEATLIVALFNPRQSTWAEHFEFRGASIVGLTPTGRATVRLLRMNDPARLQLRSW